MPISKLSQKPPANYVSLMARFMNSAGPANFATFAWETARGRFGSIKRTSTPTESLVSLVEKILSPRKIREHKK